MRELLAGKRKQIVTAIIIVLAVVAALGAGALLRMVLQGDKAAPNATAGITDTRSTEVRKSQDLITAGKLDDARKYVSDELAKQDLTASQKYELYLQQGGIARNEDKKQEALDNYKKAEEFKQTYEVSSLIGGLSYEMGDKATAVKYWKKELTQLDKQDPLYDDEKATLEQQIKDAGGSL